MAQEIKLNRGFLALVDDEDYPLVSKYKWSVTIKQGKPYAIRREHHHIAKYTYAGQMIYLHAVIAKPRKGQVVDHINGNTLDCRRGNLRACSNTDNCRNREMGKNNTSGYKGVRYTPKTGRWRGMIMVNRKNIHLGYFNTREQAAEAYNKAALKYFGEFAKLNIIPSENAA